MDDLDELIKEYNQIRANSVFAERIPKAERQQALGGMAEELELGQWPGDEHVVQDVQQAKTRRSIGRIREQRAERYSQVQKARSKEEELKTADRLANPTLSDRVSGMVSGIVSSIFPADQEQRSITDLPTSTSTTTVEGPRPTSVTPPVTPESLGLPAASPAIIPADRRIPQESPRPNKHNRTELNPDDEEYFREWYRDWAQETGLDPDPDHPDHHYDFRGAWHAAMEPAQDVDPNTGETIWTWPEEFKDQTKPVPAKTREGRQILRLPDGSFETEKTITIADPRINGGFPTNIPTIMGGKHVTPEKAIELIAKAKGVDPDTGRVLPRFSTIEEAVQAAKTRSEALGREIGSRIPPLPRSPITPAPTTSSIEEDFASKNRTFQSRTFRLPNLDARLQAGVSPDQITNPLTRYPAIEPLSLGQAFSEAGKSVLRGLANVSADTVKWIGIAAKQLDDEFTSLGGRNPKQLEQYATYRIAQKMKELSERLFPGRKDLQENFLLSKIPEAFGSSLAFLAGGVAGQALKVPIAVMPAVTGAMAQGAQQYSEAKSFQADDQTARTAFLLGSAIGTSEALPVSDLLNRLAPGIRTTLIEALKQGSIQAVEELLQEGGQQLATNAIAWLYDKNRRLADHVAEGMGAGGIIGFLTGFLLAGTRARTAPAGPSPVPPPSSPMGEPPATTPESMGAAPARALTEDDLINVPEIVVRPDTTDADVKSQIDQAIAAGTSERRQEFNPRDFLTESERLDYDRLSEEQAWEASSENRQKIDALHRLARSRQQNGEKMISRPVAPASTPQEETVPPAAGPTSPTLTDTPLSRRTPEAMTPTDTGTNGVTDDLAPTEGVTPDRIGAGVVEEPTSEAGVQPSEIGETPLSARPSGGITLKAQEGGPTELQAKRFGLAPLVPADKSGIDDLDLAKRVGAGDTVKASSPSRESILPPSATPESIGTSGPPTTPDRTRKVFLGKSGQRNLVFADPLHAELFDFTGRVRRAAKGEREFNVAHAERRLKHLLQLPDDTNIGALSSDYFQAVLTLAKKAKVGETVNVPAPQPGRPVTITETEITPTREGLVGREVGRDTVMPEQVTTASALGPEPDPKTQASSKVSTWVEAQLNAGTPFTKVELNQQADRAFAGTKADGAYTPKDAFDAVEMGINRHLLKKGQVFSPSVATTVEQAEQRVRMIRDQIIDQIPSLSHYRTAEQDEFQQFSTPHDLAYVMNWAANEGADDTVLEPSAGLGGLAVFAKIAGATVVTNELSPRRANLLKTLDLGPVYEENAEQLHNILPAHIRPTVILMNPPFSSTAGRMAGQRKSSNVIQHLEQAIQRLQPSGRLVALIGRPKEGMKGKQTAVEQWIADTARRYALRARIGLSGQGYAKYGTTFDNQILVFDKLEPTGEAPPVVAEVRDVLDAIQLLAPVRSARERQEARSAQPSGVSTPESLGIEDRPGLSASAPTRLVGPGSGTPVPGRTPDSIAPGGGRIPGKPPRSESGVGVSPDQSGRSRRAAAGSDATGGGPDTARSESTSAERPASPAERGPESPRDVPASVSTESGITVASSSTGELRANTESLTDSVYDSYQPARLRVPGAKPHPGPLVESAAMASTLPPVPTYQPNLPKELIEQGRLSLAQLESVVYAGQAHSVMLPDGTRRGFFIGDGTGVGKGREISGILLDNMRQGRTKAIWISEKANLVKSAIRDWSDLGGDPKAIFELGKHKLGAAIPNPSGIVFSTYTTLASGLEAMKGGGLKERSDKKTGQGKGSRLDQVINWVGKDFDGVLIFDEAHNMQNSISQKGKRGDTNPAAMALAAVELQKRLPKARVVYVSATGATRVDAMVYAERLGLWGTGTPFANKEVFIGKIRDGGLAAMEIVARDMKAMGLYLSRSLDYRDVTYKKLEHQLTPEQHDIYDVLAKSWQIVLKNMDSAMDLTGAKKNARAKSAARAKFWGSHQRFFNQVLTSIQMPSVIRSMREELAAGHAVVVQLVNTNEAIQNRQIEEREQNEEGLDDLDLTPRQNLMQYVQNAFPTQQYEEYLDEEGHKRSRPVVDSQGNPVHNQVALEMREDLLRQLGAIKVPEGPLEFILNTFGPEAVAEITGRTQRLVKVQDDLGREKTIKQKRSRAITSAEAKLFQDDQRQILVFSDAGGTGESYHADLRAKNQRKRIHYLLQAGWRADKAVQGLGRTHRTNQASAPHYKLVTTDLKGHRRFISTIARRLDQLGALTKGQRQTGSSGLIDAKDNLENEYASGAVRQLITDSLYGQEPTVPFAEILEAKMGLDGLRDENGQLNETRMPDVPQFLNRILALEIEEQNAVFDAFYTRMERAIEAAAAKGTLDVGMETIRTDGATIANERVVYIQPESGAETKLIEIDAKHTVNFIPSSEMEEHVGFKGYYRNIASGRVWGMAAAGTETLESGAVVDRFKAFSPVDGQYQYITEDVLKNQKKWEGISKTQGRAAWDAFIAEHPPFRTERLNLLSGALLPIWDRLPSLNVRVVRLKTDDGQRLLGRLIKPADLSAVLRRLDVHSPSVALTGAQALRQVLEHNSTLILVNDWKIKRAKVAGEARVELTGRDVYQSLRELKSYGLIVERIGFDTRYFLPTDKPSVLDQILKYKPIAEVLTPDAASPSFARRTVIREPNYAMFRTAMPQAKRIGTTRYRLIDSSSQFPDKFMQDLARRPHVAQLTRTLAQVFEAIKTTLLPSDPTFASVHFVGVSPDDFYLGVNLEGKYLAPTGQGPDVVILNPWTVMWYIAKARKGSVLATEDKVLEHTAGKLLDVLLHEITHQQVRTTHRDDKRADFSRQLSRNYGIVGAVNLDAWQRELMASLESGGDASPIRQLPHDLAQQLRFWRQGTRLSLSGLHLSAKSAGAGGGPNVAGEGSRGRTGPPTDLRRGGPPPPSTLDRSPAFQRRGPDHGLRTFLFSSADPDVEARIQAASRGLGKTGLRSRVHEALEVSWKKLTREFEFLPDTAQFAQLRTDLLQLRKQKPISIDRQLRYLHQLVGDLIPEDYALFERAILLRDLKREADAGRLLPFGYAPKILEVDLARVEAEVANNLLVQNRLAQRAAHIQAVTRAYQAAMQQIGFDVSKKLTKEDYFHHQVLEYARERAASSPVQGTGKRIKTPTGSGFLKQRHGSTLDINANYVQAELEVLGKMDYDIYLATVIHHVDQQHNMQPQLKEEARKANEAALQQRLAAEGPVGGPLSDELDLIRQRIGMHMSRLKTALGLKPTDRLTIEQIQAIAQDPQATGHPSALGVFKWINARRQFVKKVLGASYRTWEDLIPDTHRTWQPREGNLFYMADTIPHQLAQQLQARMMEQLSITEEQVKRVLALGGKREQYVIPHEVADTLDHFQPPPSGIIDQISRQILGHWKAGKLVGPHSVIKYNLRNLTGDTEATFVGNPRAFKRVWQAMQDLWPVFTKSRPLEGSVKDWYERGGMGTLLQTNEMGDVNDLKIFKALIDRTEKGGVSGAVTSAFAKYWKSARLATDFREAILRYANYLEYLDQIKTNGKPLNYGASIKETVDAMADPKDQAFKLANELVGAYDRISVFGEHLRRHWIPFWSWKEVNFTRYKQLVKNALVDSNVPGLARATVGRAAVQGVSFLFKATFLWSMALLWNYLFFPDEEKELGERTRNRIHIIIPPGRDEHGKILYLDGIGALGDLLAWVGLDSAASHLMAGDLLHDRMTLPELAKLMLKAPVNIVVQGLNPILKLPAELAAGRSAFPDVFRPRVIQDPVEYSVQQLTPFGPEYRAATGKPGVPYLGMESVEELVVSRQDPGWAAYSTWSDIEDKWKARLGKPTYEGFRRSPKGQALAHWRQAVQLGDAASVRKYQQQYKDLGGDLKSLKASIRAMAPLQGLTKDERAYIIGQLDRTELNALKRAEQFYLTDVLKILPPLARTEVLGSLMEHQGLSATIVPKQTMPPKLPAPGVALP